MKRILWACALLSVACAATPAPKSEDSANAMPPEPASTAAPVAAPTAEPAPASTQSAGSGATLVRCKTEDRISGKDAQTLVAAGAALVDVRSPAEFAERHVPGAQNVPVDELEKRMSELPKDHPVVVYCRSGMRAAKAAALLRAAGYDARNMGGVDAWGSTDC